MMLKHSGEDFPCSEAVVLLSSSLGVTQIVTPEMFSPLLTAVACECCFRLQDSVPAAAGCKADEHSVDERGSKLVVGCAQQLTVQAEKWPAHAPRREAAGQPRRTVSQNRYDTVAGQGEGTESEV
eukprot:g29900.t1